LEILEGFPENSFRIFEGFLRDSLRFLRILFRFFGDSLRILEGFLRDSLRII